MKKFKVGDSVRLKKNLKVMNMYGKLTLLRGMVFSGFMKIKAIEDPWLIYFEGTDYGYSSHMLTKEKP